MIVLGQTPTGTIEILIPDPPPDPLIAQYAAATTTGAGTPQIAQPQLTLPIKAAMDAATEVAIVLSGNNYVLENSETENDLSETTTTSTSTTEIGTPVTVQNATAIDTISMDIKNTSLENSNDATEVTTTSGYPALSEVGTPLTVINTSSVNTLGMDIHGAGGGNAYAYYKLNTGSWNLIGGGTGSQTYVTFLASNVTLTAGDVIHWGLSATTGFTAYSKNRVLNNTATVSASYKINTGSWIPIGTNTTVTYATVSVSNVSLNKSDVIHWGLSTSGSGNPAYSKNRIYNSTDAKITGTIKSAAIAKNTNIGLRYWGSINWNLVAGAALSTIAAKICDSGGTQLQTRANIQGVRC